MSLGIQGIPGRNLLPYRSGYGAEVQAGSDAKWLTIGGSIDWNLFAPLGSNLTLLDTELLLAGWRFARYGQVLTRVTNAASNILTIGGGATGGNFTVAVTALGSTDTATVPFGSTAAQVQALVQALLNVGYGNAFVSGPNGGPYSFNFSPTLAPVTVATSAAGLTGGTPTSVFAAGAGGNLRFFGPYDPAASDGRQNLNRGDCGILNRTIVMGGSLQLPLQDDLHTSLLVGGTVWGAKLLGTTGTHSLAAGPTMTELLAALPITPIYA